MSTFTRLAAFACLLAGCHPWHLPSNAPGHVDVHVAPQQIEKRGVEVPRDPGENWFVLSGGGFAGGGGRWGGGGSRGGRGVYGVGVELSAHLGRRPQSHARDDFFFFPAESVGLNVGWTFAEPEGAGVGAGYVELQAFYLLGGAALGYAFDVDDGLHGPQATFFFGPIYVRVTHLFDRGTDLQVGILFKWALSWVWSR